MTDTLTISFRERNEQREAILVVEYPDSSRYPRTFEGEHAERVWSELGRIIGEMPEDETGIAR